MQAAVEEAGFETDVRGKSVTALEIEFGVLGNPDQQQRCFYYFREPLPYDEMPAETLPVVEKLNGLLARLEAAFRRERSFTADAAHELRTPLAGARSTLEVALSRPRDAGEYPEALADTLAITTHMQSMVDSLLMLARLDAGQVELHSEPVHLPALVESTWQAVADRARSRGLAFESRLAPGLSATCDREMLSMVLAGLLGNAADHADENGRVWVAGRAAAADLVEITVANTGCGLSQDDVSRVFDRFWRGDSARTGAAIHSGLGLTLVRRAVEALGGTVSANVDDDGVFTVPVIIPAAT